MSKLKLEMDALAVESFATAADAADGRGTVHGRGAVWTDPFFCDTQRDCKTILTYCPCTPRGDGF